MNPAERTTTATTTTTKATKPMTATVDDKRKSFLKKTASFDDISSLPRNTSIEDVKQKSEAPVVEEEEDEQSFSKGSWMMMIF